MPESVHYDYFVVNKNDTISLYIDDEAQPFKTLSIDALLKKAGFEWED